MKIKLEPRKKPDTVRMRVDVTEATRDKLRRVAKNKGWTISAIVEELVKNLSE